MMSLLKLIVEAIIVPVTLVTGLVIFYIVFKTMGISVEPVFYFILIVNVNNIREPILISNFISFIFKEN